MSRDFTVATAPPSERPFVFDSIGPTLVALQEEAREADRVGDLIGGFSAMLNYAKLEKIANNGLIFLPDIIDAAHRYGVGFVHWPTNVQTPDTLPGNNRYAIFPELLTRDAERSMLSSFAPDIKTPSFTTGRRELEDPQERTEPYVLKDVLVNRGINKLLVEKPEDHEKVVEFLGTLPDDELDHVLLETFVETPTEYGTCFRVTTIPTGHIQAATLNRTADPILIHPVGDDEVIETWRPLIDPSSKFYIAPRKITSNVVKDGQRIPLQTDSYCLTRDSGNPEDEEILLYHGIYDGERRLPASVADVAVKASLALGPSLGLQLGVDILMDRELQPWLLEVNNWPSPDPVRACWGGHMTDDQIFLAAVERVFYDLSVKGNN